MLFGVRALHRFCTSSMKRRSIQSSLSRYVVIQISFSFAPHSSRHSFTISWNTLAKYQPSPLSTLINLICGHASLCLSILCRIGTGVLASSRRIHTKFFSVWAFTDGRQYLSKSFMRLPSHSSSPIFFPDLSFFHRERLNLVNM